MNFDNLWYPVVVGILIVVLVIPVVLYYGFDISIYKH